MFRRGRGCFLPIVLLVLPSQALADAVVVTQAMFASNIAEFFVEEEHLTLELEISAEDLDAFRNLLPDNVYQAMGHTPAPLAERRERFFQQDIPIVADGGLPLVGRVLELGPRQRVARDPVTGEPLREGDEEPETTVFARIEYPLPARPERLTLFALRGPASIGFVAYHRGIPLNDFRYLAPQQTLQLDWQDPWYSAFERRSLRRQYFAPMSGFLYVEPYEVRKEIVARPRDLQSWVDLGLEGRETIPPEMQPELLRQAAEFLRNHHRVLIDGREIVPELERANFLERSLRTSRVIDPPIELDVFSAILGVIFVYPTRGLPETVTLDWDLWNERIQQVPAASVDQAGPLPAILEPGSRVLEWRNFLKNPELPTLQVLAKPPGVAVRAAWFLRWPALAVALAGLVWWLRSRKQGAPGRGPALTAALGVPLAFVCLAFGYDARLSDERTNEVVAGLLHNVYRAFDFREEERIYDVLAESASGDLLATLYLETRSGLELANQGGARAKVKQIDMIALDTAVAEAGGFIATATWKVAGSVGHWGHVHQRENQYRAELAIAPVEGNWKLIGMEVLGEERL